MSETNNTYCVILPVYNQRSFIASITEHIHGLGLKCFIVDDGSGKKTRTQLMEAAEKYPETEILTHESNQGKGAALKTGFKKAFNEGFTHCIQIDADGQHSPDAIPDFINKSKGQPEAMILGTPVFDETVPGERLHGRKVTHFWTHITTLSGNIKDGLCGFRCYPLAPVVKLISKKKTGNRMEFDPEIIIRLYRNGTPAVNLPTQIRYIDNDPSHFNLLQDNLRISWMFFRFFWSTPLYLPKLIKLRKSKVNRDL